MAAEEDSEPTAPAAPASDAPDEPSDADPVEDLPEGDPPKVDFATFALSLATSALMNLQGESSDDRVPGAKISLSSAAQHIDLLVMLQTRTKGNLTEQESDLLEHLIYDLRMQYIEAAKR